MIVLYPEGYARSCLHDIDKEINPDRHNVFKNKYTRQEAWNLCIECIRLYECSNKYGYDACTDTYYRLEK